MQLFDEGGSGNSFSSHYFNITGDQSSSKSTAPSSSSSSASAKSTGATATPSDSTKSAPQKHTHSSQLKPEAGLSEGAKIGIGVGVGVGVGCLALGIAIGLIFKRQRSTTQENEKHNQGKPTELDHSNVDSGHSQGDLAAGYYAPPSIYKHVPEGYHDPLYAQQSQWPTQELHENETVHEMSGQRNPAEFTPSR